MVWLLALDCYVADGPLDPQILGSEHFGKASDQTASQAKDVDGETIDMARVGTWAAAP